jgi:hypothetical protein
VTSLESDAAPPGVHAGPDGVTNDGAICLVVRITPRALSRRRVGPRNGGKISSHLVMRGVHLATVMELAGHSSCEMTLRYAHLAPHVHQAAVALLDGPLPGTTDAVSKVTSG